MNSSSMACQTAGRLRLADTVACSSKLRRYALSSKSVETRDRPQVHMQRYRDERRGGYSMGQGLSHLSRGERLYPGELIASGTLPGGCGMETGRWLQSGGHLRLVIEDIGEITHDIA